MVGSLTGAVALTTSHNSPQRILVTGRIWLYAGTSGVSGGTNLRQKLKTVKIHPVQTISRKDLEFIKVSSTTTRQPPIYSVKI